MRRAVDVIVAAAVAAVLVPVVIFGVLPARSSSMAPDGEAVPAALAPVTSVAAAPGQPVSATPPALQATPLAAPSATHVPLRALKADLILNLTVPPGIVVLGGSRAMHFDPRDITAKTGYSAFNAAVTHARPWDAWAYLNLLHARFPQTRFHFLWVMHVDEFAAQAPNKALVQDTTLSQFFPASWVSYWSARLGVSPTVYPEVPRRPLVSGIDPRGFVVRSPWDNRPISAVPSRVQGTISHTITSYARYPARLDPQQQWYFTRTLQMMRSGGDSVVVVLAPLQPHYLAVVRDRGWAARHDLVMSYLRSMRQTYRFPLLDLSRAAKVKASPFGFYDGIHLRESTSNRVFTKVWRTVPWALR